MLKKLGELQAVDYMLLVDADSISSLCRDYPMIDDDITGAITMASNGDYDEIWITTASKPYLLTATYERILP